ncbi:MAG: hypothetical protein GX571_04805 [Lentisphaerae bacterium]|jgi:curli biogenesis system outer membrane secretion channel CsgG|nr:hypothetical protein [Lentisphaerota bacterium]
MKRKHSWCNAGALAGLILLAAGCATVDESYFLDTRTNANVFVAPQARGAVDPIKKIAVMPFKADSELVGNSASDVFLTEIMRTGRYELVERTRMAQVLSESELALAGLSAAKATEIGSMLGAEAVVIGTVDEYAMHTYRKQAYPVTAMSARLIDCKTGQVVWSVDLAKRGTNPRIVLSEHMRSVAHEMVAALYRRWHR